MKHGMWSRKREIKQVLSSWAIIQGLVAVTGSDKIWVKAKRYLSVFTWKVYVIIQFHCELQNNTGTVIILLCVFWDAHLSIFWWSSSSSHSDMVIVVSSDYFAFLYFYNPLSERVGLHLAFTVINFVSVVPNNSCAIGLFKMFSHWIFHSFTAQIQSQ